MEKRKKEPIKKRWESERGQMGDAAPSETVGGDSEGQMEDANLGGSKVLTMG
jgi:hypothetical protein